MKSLVEEASTITKAVEKAWIRAGKPAEFTVKIFEEPKHNFLGMTTKSAKIALFFKSTASAAASHQPEPRDQKQVQKEQPRRQPQSRHNQESASPHTQHNKNYGSEFRGEKDQRSAGSQRPVKNDRRDAREYTKQIEQSREVRDRQEQRPQRDGYERPMHQDRPSHRNRDMRGRERPDAVWSNEMADIAQDWLEHMLIVLDKRELLAQAKVVGSNLKFEFKSPIIEDKDKEKLLFASWAHLILASVGNKYKKDLHGLKVILLSPE